MCDSSNNLKIESMSSALNGLLHQFVVEPCGPMKNFMSFKSIVHFISTLREHFYCCTLIIDDNLWMAHWK